MLLLPFAELDLKTVSGFIPGQENWSMLAIARVACLAMTLVSKLGL